MSLDNKTTNSIKQLMTRSLVIAASVLLSTVAGTGVATAGDSGGEGIKVHGEWVVTVTNQDGSVAQERHFSNALSGGAGLLASLLAGRQGASAPENFVEIDQRAPGIPNWHIEVLTTGVSNTEECMGYLVDDGPNGAPRDRLFANVIGFTGVGFTLTRGLALAADCISGANYAINAVRSAFPGTGYFGGTGFPNYFSFSEKTLDAPITGILPDQLVTLKVTFSFE